MFTGCGPYSRLLSFPPDHSGVVKPAQAGIQPVQDLQLVDNKSGSIQSRNQACGFAAIAQLEHMVQHDVPMGALSKGEEFKVMKHVGLNQLKQSYVENNNVYKISDTAGNIIRTPSEDVKKELDKLIVIRNQELNGKNQTHTEQKEEKIMMEGSSMVNQGTQASSTEAEESISKLTKKNEELVKKVGELELDKSDLNNELINKKKQLEEVISEATTVERENTQLKKKLDKNLTKNESLKSKIAGLEAEIAGLEAEREKIYAEITRVKSHNEILSSNYSILSAQPLKTTADQGTQAVGSISKAVSDARSVNNGYVQDIAKLHNEIVERDQELEQATKKIEALEQSLRKLKISQGSTKNIQSSREDMEDADILTIIRKAEKLYGALQAYSTFKRSSDKNNEAKHQVADKRAKQHLEALRALLNEHEVESFNELQELDEMGAETKPDSSQIAHPDKDSKVTTEVVVITKPIVNIVQLTEVRSSESNSVINQTKVFEGNSGNPGDEPQDLTKLARSTLDAAYEFALDQVDNTLGLEDHKQEQSKPEGSGNTKESQGFKNEDNQGYVWSEEALSSLIRQVDDSKTIADIIAQVRRQLTLLEALGKQSGESSEAQKQLQAYLNSLTALSGQAGQESTEWSDADVGKADAVELVKSEDIVSIVTEVKAQLQSLKTLFFSSEKKLPIGRDPIRNAYRQGWLSLGKLETLKAILGISTGLKTTETEDTDGLSLDFVFSEIDENNFEDESKSKFNSLQVVNPDIDSKEVVKATTKPKVNNMAQPTNEGVATTPSEKSDSKPESHDSQTPSSSPHSVRIGFELKTIYPENDGEAEALIKLFGKDKATKQSYNAENLTFKLDDKNGGRGEICTLQKISEKEVDFRVSEGSLIDFIGQLDQMVHALLTQKKDFRPSSIDLSGLKVDTQDEVEKINEFIKNLKNRNIEIKLPNGVAFETESQDSSKRTEPPVLLLLNRASTQNQEARNASSTAALAISSHG